MATQNKRKFNEMETQITDDLMLQNGIMNLSIHGGQQPPCKRKQSSALFRPWEDKVKTSNAFQEKKPKVQQKIRNLSNQNDSNLRFILEQPKYNPYTQTPPANLQTEQQLLQQYYMAQKQQQQYALWMEQSYRSNLYLRHLQQSVVRSQQQQLFVFGQPR